MKRSILISSFLIVLTLFWSGCQTLSDMTVSEEERNLRRLKRGNLSDAGVYTNSFYQLEFRVPEGWTGVLNDPPEILKVMPSSKEVSQGSARKFVSINLRVMDRVEDETVEQFVEKYTSLKGYEKILERPASVYGFPSSKLLFYGKEEGKEIKISALIVLRDKMVNILECKAQKQHFDNFESKFGMCLESFKATGTDVPKPVDEKPYEAIDPATDYITYIVTPTDTLPGLAKSFLGSEERTWVIISMNESEKINAGDRLKIPRSLPYELQSGDTWQIISQKILGDPVYAEVVRDYNGKVDLATAKQIQIPLYTTETPVVGDSYVEISRRKYNDESLAQRLMEYNNLEPLDALKSVKMPIFLTDRYYVYKVQPNDSLAWIARWLTGDPNNYVRIGEVNGIEYPYRLIIGQELKIPASMVPDPTVFEKPLPKSKPTEKPASQKAPVEPTPKPAPDATSTATPTPRPISDTGMFDIE